MSGRGYSILAGVIIVVGVAVLIGTVFFVSQRQDAQREQELASIPTVAVVPTITPLPSFTPSRTPRPTLPGTFTPTPTITPTPTETLTPTFTPSITPTITDTPSLTPTLASSLTPTPTRTPTATNTSNLPSATPTNTRSPFPFQLRGGEVLFTSNTGNIYNEQGCAYQGIGGQVLDLQRSGINGLVKVVVISEDGTQFAQDAGDDSRFGANGGFGIGVDTKPNRRSYFVEVRTIQSGVAVSPLVEVTFPSDCDRNIALLYWEQTRPF